MTVDEVSKIDDIVDGKSNRFDFFKSYEKLLFEYVNSFYEAKAFKEKTVQALLIKAAEELFIAWYESEKKLPRVTNIGIKYYPIEDKSVLETLQRLILPAIISFIDTQHELITEFNSSLNNLIQLAYLKVIKEKVVENQLTINNELLAIIQQSIYIVLSGLKRKNRSSYAQVMASDENYLCDRVKEQVLVHRIKQNDNQAVDELISFTWLGTARKKDCENVFKSKIIMGIKADFYFQKIKQEITYVNERYEEEIIPSYIFYATEYIWCKLVLGDEETPIGETPFHSKDFALIASLNTYISDHIFQTKDRGKIQNFIRKKSVQKKFGYVLEEHIEEVHSETKNEDTRDDNIHLELKDIVKKVFWVSKLYNCRKYLLNHEEALKILEYYLGDDPSFIEELDKASSIKDKNNSFRVRCSQCYSMFKSEISKGGRDR